MKTFQKGIAKVLFYVISGALLFYASSRSLDFINSTLSAQDKIVGFLGLAATSGGMISWLLIFMYSADGLGQKITSAIMVAVDLIGEIALFTFDTLYRTGQNGMTSALAPDEIKVVVLVLSGLIALNILSTVVFHLVEPEAMKRMRIAFVQDHLESETLKLIEKQGEEIARNQAPILAQQWREDFEARFSDMKSLGLGTVEEKKKDAKKFTLSKVVPIFRNYNANAHAEGVKDTAPLLFPPLAKNKGVIEEKSESSSE